MHKITRMIARIAALLMALLALAGCSAVNDPVVAKVGDVEISYSSFYNTFNNIKQYYDYGAYQVEDPEHPLPELREDTFEELINAAIPVAIAHQRGMTLNAEEEAKLAETVETNVQDNIKEVTSGMAEGATEEQKLNYFKRVVRGNGYSYDKYLAMMEESARDQMLSDKIKAEVEAPAEVDDETLNQWYEEQIAFEKESYSENPIAYYENLEYYTYFTGVPPLYRPDGFVFAKQILIMNPAEGETKDMDAIVAEVQKKIDAGEDFDALVAEYNEDPGMASNPDGYLFHELIADKYYAEFSDAIKGLKDGEISGPVESEAGVHFIYRTGPAPEKITPLDEVREQAYTYALNTAKEDLYSEAMEEWRASLEIVTYPKRVETVGMGSSQQQG